MTVRQPFKATPQIGEGAAVLAGRPSVSVWRLAVRRLLSGTRTGPTWPGKLVGRKPAGERGRIGGTVLGWTALGLIAGGALLSAGLLSARVMVPGVVGRREPGGGRVVAGQSCGGDAGGWQAGGGRAGGGRAGRYGQRRERRARGTGRTRLADFRCVTWHSVIAHKYVALSY